VSPAVGAAVPTLYFVTDIINPPIIVLIKIKASKVSLRGPRLIPLRHYELN
jgi:hypothetical protein